MQKLTLYEEVAHPANIRLSLSTDSTNTIWFTTIADLGVMSTESVKL